MRIVKAQAIASIKLIARTNPSALRYQLFPDTCKPPRAGSS
jgi:hypothetical protein